MDNGESESEKKAVDLIRLLDKPIGNNDPKIVRIKKYTYTVVLLASAIVLVILKMRSIPDLSSRDYFGVILLLMVALICVRIVMFALKSSVSSFVVLVISFLVIAVVYVAFFESQRVTDFLHSIENWKRDVAVVDTVGQNPWKNKDSHKSGQKIPPTIAVKPTEYFTIKIVVNSDMSNCEVLIDGIPQPVNGELLMKQVKIVKIGKARELILKTSTSKCVKLIQENDIELNQAGMNCEAL